VNPRNLGMPLRGLTMILKVDFLPLVCNGDVVFELPPVRSFVGNSQATLMVEWTSDTMDMPGPKLLCHIS
jgi:hypothetical protein